MLNVDFLKKGQDQSFSSDFLHDFGVLVIESL